MRRTTVLCVMLIAPAQALAADAETIVVTGRSLELPPGSAAYSVSILDGARLRDSASGRIENALEEAAGFQLFRRTDSRSANPTSQGATLRGIGGNASTRALVLLDGVPVADPFAGWIAWPSIKPESLDFVRVTAGGGAGGFGAGALSGVIELTSAGPDRAAAAHVDYGSRDSVASYAGGTLHLGEGFVAFDAGYDEGNGYYLIPKSDRGAVDIPAKYQQYGGSVRMVLPIAAETELQVRGAAFSDDRTRGIAIVDSKNSGADASIRVVSKGDLPWEALAYIQSRDFSARFARINAGRASATPTLDQFDVPATGLGAKVELRPTFGSHALRAGADWRRATGTTKEYFTFVAGAYTRYREAGGDSDVYGLFVEDDFEIGEDLVLNAGVRLDRWELDDGSILERQIAGPTITAKNFKNRAGTEPTARLGAAYQLTPAIKLRSAAYLGFRVPTLNELYRPFRVGADATAANAELKPERMRGIEVGTDYQPLSNASAGLTFFYNRAENAIGNVTLGRGPGVFPGVGFVAGTYRQRLNLDAIDAVGVEFHGNAELGRWSLAAAYAFTDSTVDASGVAAALDGKRTAQVPEHQASASATYAVNGWSANLVLRYDGLRYEDDLEKLRLPSAFTVDASARIPIAKSLSLRLAAENLFDEEIVAGRADDGLIDRGQPRTFWVGIGWTPRR